MVPPKELARGGDGSPVIPRAPPSGSYDGVDGEASAFLYYFLFSFLVAGLVTVKEGIHR